MQRVITCVDGFNLYFGLKSAGYRHLYWLDVAALSRALLKGPQQLVCAKYFTSRISGPPDKVKRQGLYIEALQTLTDCRCFFGHYLTQSRTCRRCGNVESIPTEKMTDVNIAVALLSDAFLDAFDTAIVISADSDLTSPITAIRQLFSQKRVIVAFPPKRYSVTLKNVAHGAFEIGRSKFAQSQFPREVIKPDGFVLCWPKEWI
jgi:hypothetical protein